MSKYERGIDESQEQLTSSLLRDTRTLGQRVAAFLSNSANATITLTILAVLGFVVPALVEVTFLISVWLFFYSISRKYRLPFRMPKHAKRVDYNTPKPGSDEPSMADGIYFFGNDRKTNEELWFTNNDMRTHVLIFGSTGSGKTEALISLAYNALLQGSGFIYVDGKGDNSLFAKIFSLARMMGREDDLLLINFMTGARDIVGPQEKRLSNTMNPFARGSSSMLTQLVVSLMDSSSSSSSGDMWKGRAIAFVEALMRILVAMRDAGHILLDANAIRNYFSLERLEAMVMDKAFMRDDQPPVNISDLPSIVLEPITNYLINLPGYNREKKGKQVSQVYEQHGYITMQLTRVFSSLADTYGHIIRTNLPEVDLKDVVLNRRILVVLLPALEKSPDELANLGKVIIASLKAMMAAGLGEDVEGEYADIVESKPTNANTPYLCILDEYGHYAVPGFAVVPAQARSLGFSVVFAGQDLPAFQKASKEEAASIGANTNIKICMKLEDPMETWEFFMKSAGEAHVSVVSGYQNDAGSISSRYLDSRNAQIEKRTRVDLLDLKEQREGESHIFFRSRIVRAKMFYVNPKPVKELRVNQFVKVGPPKDEVLASLMEGFKNFEQLVAKGNKIFDGLDTKDFIIDELAKGFDNLSNTYPVDAAIDIFMRCSEVSRLANEPSTSNSSLGKDEKDIYSELLIPGYLTHVLTEEEADEFITPIVSKYQLLETCKAIEDALVFHLNVKVLSELIGDLSVVTRYPLKFNKFYDAKILAEEINSFLENR